MKRLMNWVGRFAAILGLLAVASVPARAGVVYQLKDLGVLGGGYSNAYGVNNSGQVAGSSPSTIHSNFRAYLSDVNGGSLKELGTLGGTRSDGYGVNDNGQVVGSSSTVNETSYHAFLSAADGGPLKDLNTLGGTSSFGLGVNNSGQVVGYSNTIGDTAFHAFLSDANGGTLKDLNTLGGINSFGFGVNDAGQATGYSFLSGFSDQRAFFYDGTLKNLGTLGGSSSSGLDINNSGQVVGYSQTNDGSTHAFLSDANGGSLNDLGVLTGYIHSYGYGVNDAGQAVGYLSNAGGDVRSAFLYSNGSMINLNDHLPSNSAFSALTEARAINNNGQIVGVGLVGFETHAFLMTITNDDDVVATPEPSTVVASGTGLILALGFGWRRRRAADDREVQPEP